MMRTPKPLEEAGLWEYSLKLLGGRAQSIGEVREKLKRRASTPADVDRVLAKLKQYGYLDDARFAAAYAGARLENQGFGKMRVLRDLRVRRIAPALAERAVAQTFESTDEVQLIEEFLARKYRRVVLGSFLAEPKNLAAAYRRLRHAGFGGGNSIRVLKRFSAQAEALEGLEDAEEGAGTAPGS